MNSFIDTHMWDVITLLLMAGSVIFGYVLGHKAGCDTSFKGYNKWLRALVVHRRWFVFDEKIYAVVLASELPPDFPPLLIHPEDLSDEEDLL